MEPTSQTSERRSRGMTLVGLAGCCLIAEQPLLVSRRTSEFRT